MIQHLTTGLFTLIFAVGGWAQITDKGAGTINVRRDSLQSDTVSKELKASPNALEKEVIYSSEDSMRFDLENKKIYLYGNADVKYDKIHLQAAYIEIDWSTNVIHAEGVVDSAGNKIGSPKFSEGSQNFDALKMDYNFKTKKGKITKVYTQQGEGFLLGEQVKKDENNAFFVKNGKFTTCNLPDHPHFYINATKVKVIPDDKIVTGPANLVIEEIPSPLLVPFGIFPNTSGRKSGILFPTYGESPGLGFFLMDGGYYWGLNDHFDASLRGDIYSRGSWGLKAGSSYNFRYRFNGNVDMRYATILQGDPELLGSSVNKSFFITWRHNQDPKSRPNSRFSANVNAGSSDYNQLNSFNTNNIVANTFQSAVTWSKTFARAPLNLNVSAGHSQNTQTRIITVNAPEIQLNMNRIFPFKRKDAVGAQRFYEKIGLTGTLQSRNTISQPDSVYMQPGLARKFNNGVQFQLPLTTSFQMLRYFTVTPSFNLTGRGYFSNIRKRYDAESQQTVTDTIRQFSQLWEYNASVNASTRVYSFLKLGKNTVRHVATVQAGFRYQPDFSTEEFGFFGTGGTLASYSPYEQGIYGQPSRGKQGTINIGVNNNIEAKVRSQSDSTGSGLKKITLFDAFNFNTGYNLAVDTLNLQPLTINARTKIARKVDLVYSSSWDWYAFDTVSLKRINVLEYNASGKWLRHQNTSLAINTMLASAAPKKNADAEQQNEGKEMINNPNAYVNFNIPWSFSGGVIIGQTQSGAQILRNAILNFSGDVSLTEKWKISFSSGYDFEQKEISFTSIDIYRDLHCWEMRFNWIPFGFRQSYNFTINVKSGMLQDLKLNRRRQWFDLQDEP